MTTPDQQPPAINAAPGADGAPPDTPPPTRRKIRGVWIFIAAASLVLLARGLLTPAPATTTPPVTAGHTATPLPPAPLVGHLAPDVTLLDLAGHQVPLSSFRGQIVILNFWYIACDPCRYEMPLIEKVYHADRGQGVVVIGLNMTDSAPDISSYVHSIGIDYTILRDSAQRGVVGYNITSTPATFIIDRQGVIRAKFVGAITESATLEQAITPLLSAH